MRIINRMVAALVVVLGVALVAPTPAEARTTRCFTLGGNPGSQVEMCLSDGLVYNRDGISRGVRLSSLVEIGDGFTAGDSLCKVTMRIELSMSASGASPWGPGGVAAGCTEAVLEAEATGFGSSGTLHTIVGTQATYGRTVGCVDLNKPGYPSFWQRCAASAWHLLTDENGPNT